MPYTKVTRDQFEWDGERVVHTPTNARFWLPDRMSTPRRPDAGVPQRPRPAPDAHASLLKLPPPQIIFCAATPAPGLRPLVWVNAP
jgi:hypothetical protein